LQLKDYKEALTFLADVHAKARSQLAVAQSQTSTCIALEHQAAALTSQLQQEQKANIDLRGLIAKGLLEIEAQVDRDFDVIDATLTYAQQLESENRRLKSALLPHTLIATDATVTAPDITQALSELRDITARRRLQRLERKKKEQEARAQLMAENDAETIPGKFTEPLSAPHQDTSQAASAVTAGADTGELGS
jgi:hypothetical protein